MRDDDSLLDTPEDAAVTHAWSRWSVAERQPTETLRFSSAWLREQLEGQTAPIERGAPRFEVQGTLGRGGHSVVRSALQVNLDREVAIKECRTDVAADAGQLLHEARILAHLDHPNIVSVLDILEEPGQPPRVVMQRIRGRTWRDLLGEKRKDALVSDIRVMVSVCNALEYAHQRGILHRDVKPANIMVGRFGQVYLVDWGIAVSLRNAHRGRLPLAADQSEAVGTPAFMAPEMVTADWSRLEMRTDVYLVGGCIYRFAGRRPLRTGSLRNMLRSAIRGELPERPPEMPGALWRIAKACLAPEPGDRPQIGEVRGALQEAIEGRALDHLMESATRSLEDFRHHVEQSSPDSEVHASFAETRSLFDAIVRANPSRKDAEHGKQTAITEMVRYAVGRDDSRLATALLPSVRLPPPALVESVRKLGKSTRAAQNELDRLRADADPRTYLGTRMFVGAAIGMTVVGVNLFTAITLPPSFGRGFLTLALILGICGLIVAIGWSRLGLTQRNRTLAKLAFLGPALCLPTMLGAWLAGLDSNMGGAHTLLVFSVLLWVVCFIDDLRLMPSAAAMSVCFLMVCAFPGWLVPIIAFSALCVLANVVMVAVLGAVVRFTASRAAVPGASSRPTVR